MTEISQFCERLGKKSGLRNIEKALALLWFRDKEAPGAEMSPAALRDELRSHGLGSPTVSHLRAALSKSRLTLKGAVGYRLNQRGRSQIRELAADAVEGEPTEGDASISFLPDPVWQGTRGYIQKVCAQLNGCYHHGYYDAAAVMIRRVIETLIIECYEHLQRESEIKSTDGVYVMLGELVTRCTSQVGINLSRETCEALRDIKKLGDRSAHNRRFVARRSDLDGLRTGLRVAMDDLIAIAGLR